MLIKRGDLIKVTFTNTDVSVNYKVKGVAQDGTFMTVEEGPGLSAVLRFNPAQPEPTWRLEGAPITITEVG